MNIEELRNLCLNLTAVTEDVKWGNDLCFCVGEKMFCVTGLKSDEFGASFKASPSDFEGLIERDGITPAKYLARYGWVYVKGENVLSIIEWKKYIQASYRMVGGKLPVKQHLELNLN